MRKQLFFLRSCIFFLLSDKNILEQYKITSSNSLHTIVLSIENCFLSVHVYLYTLHVHVLRLCKFLATTLAKKSEKPSKNNIIRVSSSCRVYSSTETTLVTLTPTYFLNHTCRINNFKKLSK